MGYRGITAKNEEQKHLCRALESNKPFTFVTGPAGTGKTLLSVAFAVDRVFGRRSIKRVSYMRLQVSAGSELGFLPGTLAEKNAPYMRPFLDSYLKLDDMPVQPDAFDGTMIGKGADDRIVFETIQTMRGGTLDDQIVIIDEAQNLDIQTMTLIATRVGENSKVIFLGNFAQIDDPHGRYSKPETNGLFTLLSRMYSEGGDRFFNHVHLEEVLRSPAAAFVERVMREKEMDPTFARLEAHGKVDVNRSLYAEYA